MLPIDSKTGKAWSHENATTHLQDIRTRVLREFQQRDILRGFTKENGWRAYKYEMDDAGNQTGDPIFDTKLIGRRHTADEVTTVTRKRWAEFCSEPSDQDAIIADRQNLDRKESIAKSIKAGKAVESDLADEISGDAVAELTGALDMDGET